METRKFIIMAEMMDLIHQVSTDQITKSRMVEILNEMPENWLDQRLKNPSINLAKFVDPEKEYWPIYTIDNDGVKTPNTNFIKGADLTENQIVDLFKRGQLL